MRSDCRAFRFSCLFGLALLAPLWTSLAPGQDAVKAPSQPSVVLGPLFQISFESGEPVPGIGAMPAVQLPFECTSDGTVFINMIQAIGTGNPPRNLSPYSPSLLVTSVSRSREAHSFPLDQVPDLYDLQELTYYASESKVIFLVRAARENKQGQVASSDAGSAASRSASEHHFYIVMFSRLGNFERTIQLEDTFRLTRVGLFPSGMFLAYGFDQADHSPKLAMLKDDGTLLKFLELPKSDVPQSALGSKPDSESGASVYIAPVQFVGQGHSIYMVQNRTTFPLLEVNEAGAIRSINPRLPNGVRINMIVPSDADIYARVNEIQDGSIYELDSQVGTIIRRFRVGDNESGADVACVHDGNFLSFKHGDGKLVPLVGVAEHIVAIPERQPKTP